MEFKMFNNSKSSGQENGCGWAKGQTSSESRRYRVADRLKVKAGRMVRQAGTKSRNIQGSKPGGLEKENSKGSSTGKTAG